MPDGSVSNRQAYRATPIAGTVRLPGSTGLPGRVSLPGELHALSDQANPEAPDDARGDTARPRQSRQGAAQHVLAGHIQDRHRVPEELRRGAGSEAEEQAREERVAAPAARHHAENRARSVRAVLQKAVARYQGHGLFDLPAFHEGPVPPGEVRQAGVHRAKPDRAEPLQPDGSGAAGRHGPIEADQAGPGDGNARHDTAAGDNRERYRAERDLRVNAYQ